MDNPKLKYLEDVPWDNSLKLSNGKTVHGLEQLPMVIKFSDDEVFYSHVNDQKNDISNWIRDVIGDSELAEKLLNIKKKEEFIEFMDKAITEIKNYKSPEPAPVPVISVPTSAPAPTPISIPIIVPISTPVSASIVSPVPVPVISVQSTIISTPAPVISVQPALVPTPSPVVVPVVTPTIIQPVSPPNPTLAVPPVLMPLSFPQSTPLSVSSPVVSTPNISTTPTIPTTSTIDSFFVDSTSVSNAAPIPNSISMSESATTVSQTASAQVLPSVSMTEMAEETFDFEDVFKVLITELEQDVLSWDTQTS